MAKNITIGSTNFSNVNKLKVKETGTENYIDFIETSDADAVASDIISGKTAYVNGNKITGTLEVSGGGGGYSVVLYSSDMTSFSSIVDTLQYSLDDGSTWIDITRTHGYTYLYIQDIIQNVTTIKFRASCTGGGLDYISIAPRPLGGDGGVLSAYGGSGTVTSNNITLTDNQIYEIEVYKD